MSFNNYALVFNVRVLVFWALGLVFRFKVRVWARDKVSVSV